MKIFKKNNQVSHKSYAVVTGAGSGIGRSFALALAKRGGKVLCVDLNMQAAQETVALIELQWPGQAIAYQCDVAQADQVEHMAQQAADCLGHAVTLLVNNAGVGLGGRFDEVSLEDWQWCMQINLWGVIYGCHYFVPLFKQQGRGAIINVASAAGFTAAPEMAAYNVTKSGVVTLTETLAAELAKDHIDLNVLCPTLVPTNIMKNGRLPQRYASKAERLLMNHAFVNSDQVAELTLNQLDKKRLYSIPQPDAKLFWWLKRTAPSTYARILAWAYPQFQRFTQSK